MKAETIETRLREELDTVPWQACGIMDQLVVDNGLDLTSHGVQDCCTALGIDLLFTPARSPWYKGVIERFGRTLNTRFIHWLPGTTLGKPTSDLNYNGRDDATFTIETFELLLEQYIRTVHNQSPRRTKDGTPTRRYLRGIAEWPVRLPLSMDEFDAACALTRVATLRQTGLTFAGLQYQNTALGQLWNRVPQGTRLTFKVNPLNLKTIKVLRPVTEEIISVDCVDEFVWPRTLSYHLAARQQARTMDFSPDDRRSLALAEAKLMATYQLAAREGKKTLRRMEAELLRQSQAVELEDEVPAAMGPTPEAAGDLDSMLSKVFAESTQ
jgi:putative transposase